MHFTSCTFKLWWEPPTQKRSIILYTRCRTRKYEHFTTHIVSPSRTKGILLYSVRVPLVQVHDWKISQLPCWLPKLQQVSHQRWIWRIYSTQVTKYASKGFTLALKPKADIAEIKKKAISAPQKRCPPKLKKKKKQKISTQILRQHSCLCSLKTWLHVVVGIWNLKSQPTDSKPNTHQSCLKFISSSSQITQSITPKNPSHIHNETRNGWRLFLYKWIGRH